MILSGELHPRSKLKEKDVKEIRRLYAETDITLLALSEKFKVGKTQIWRILNNHSWKGK